MSQPQKEKSLIELAREHMENSGGDPETGVDIPEQPAAGAERIVSAPTPEPVKVEDIPVASEVFDGTVSDAISDLLSQVEDKGDWRNLELPSRGKAYIKSDGIVQIRPFSFKEEKKLRAIKKTNQAISVIRTLVQSCVKGLEYDAMTLEDKNYILFKLRQISYGDEYSIRAQCESCDAVNNLTLEISKVPVNYAPDDYQEPFTIMLPDSKQPLVFITPRCNDEHFLADVGMLTDNLWRWIISIGKYKDERIKKTFLEQTTVKDLSYFREQLLEDRYGMKNDVVYDCDKCGEDNQTVIPFNESFFSVS